MSAKSPSGSLGLECGFWEDNRQFVGSYSPAPGGAARRFGPPGLLLVNRPPHGRFFASRSISPVHIRNSSNSQRVSHRKLITLLRVSVSAFLPLNVSTLQRK
jgi:hypothetical protein